MMVGSDCSRMPFFSRLMKTAATRERSSARPVSFSTIEASVTNSFDGRDRQVGIAPLPDLVDQLLLIGEHLVDRPAARGVPRVKRCVSVASAALRRHRRRHVAGQGVIFGDALPGLLDRQPLRNGQRIEDRLAALQHVHDVVHRSAGLDLVLAGLELSVIAIGADADPEDARVADQAAPLELVGDVCDAVLRLDLKGGVGIAGTRCLELPLAEIDRQSAG